MCKSIRLSFLSGFIILCAISPLCGQVSETSHPSVVLAKPVVVPEMRKKTAEELELAKSVASLNQVYLNRLSLGIAYHPVALAKIKRLLDLSKGLVDRYEKDAQHKGLFAAPGPKGPSKEELFKRQEKFSGEIVFIDQLSAALIGRETIRYQEGLALDSLSRMTEKLERKKIEFLETQLRLGGSSIEK